MGGGPGAISTALAFHSRGFDVRVFERQPECKAIGGAVLLSVPVLAILRSYGVGSDKFGSHTITHFKNKAGLDRVILPFNKEVNRRMGIKGWHYGELRSSIFKEMIKLVPDGMILTDHEVVGYVEHDNEVTAEFKNGKKVTADIIVGADGIRSVISHQAFGDPKLFHTGIRLWLAWCDKMEGIPPNFGFVSHDSQYQASFFPMLHEGKPGFEWWIVEPSSPTTPVPTDPKAHIQKILNGWCDLMPRFPDATDFDTQVFRWDIYNRPSQSKWSKGRIVWVGDAIHPVSPYAAYGMGMAIEDGYYLAKYLDGVDLTNAAAVNAEFELYEAKRVNYVNHNMEFARYLGYMFHHLPQPFAKARDMIFDHTPVLGKLLCPGYLKKAENETMSLQELFVEEGVEISS